MKLGHCLVLCLGLAFIGACKQKTEDTGEDSFVKSAVTANPSLVAPISEPLTDAEDKLISSSQKTKDFYLDMPGAFDLKDVAQHQAISDSTPGPLQGIWYMDGNPLADRTVSFANLTFEPRNGKQVGYFPVFGANNYSFVGDASGDKLYTMAKDFDLIYEVSFNNEFTYGEIVPTVKIGIIRVRISPKIVSFTMTQKEDGYFVRESSFLGKPIPDYQFVRIIDKNKNPVTGTADDRWNRYLASASKIALPKLK